MIELSQRVRQVRPSATLSITARAAELRAAGRDIISLSVGEPEFPTPEAARAAGIAAIEQGRTRYTAVAGIPELRQAVAEKFRRDNALDCDAERVLISSGGKQCIYNLLMALIDPGDEVIIPAPYWVSYPDMTRLADGVPVIVETGVAHRFKLDPERLQAALTSRTRLLFLNSPSNPTGMAYDEEELRALGEVVRAHPNLFVASDDMYEKILFDGHRFHTFAQVNPDLAERTITFNGVSKAQCMTGWRIGYCTGPRELIQAMTRVHGQSTSNPCSISQYAALAALQGPDTELRRMVQTYARRREWLVDALNRIPGMQCLRPDGAFYVFPSIDTWLGGTTASGARLEDDVAVCNWLLEEAGVALVPGSAFGAPGHVRFSYAVAQDVLEEAVRRIEVAVGSLDA